MADSVSSNKAKYDFKKALQEIMGYRGRGTELISVYIPPSRMISDVMAYLREEQSQATNIKSKSTMKNVTGAIDSIMSRLRTYKNTPPSGLAIFCGEVPRAGDQTRMVQYTLEPPEEVSTFFYRCDSEFYTEPLESMLEDKKSYALIVIDRKEATLGLLSGSKISVLKHFDSLVPSKHHQGGQSSVRFERLIEIAAHEFYKKVADHATDLYLNREELQGILVGGPGSTKDFFVKEEYLHHELRKKVVTPLFDTGYTDEFGLKELVDNAGDAIADMQLVIEKNFMQRLFKEIRKPDGGLSTYGEDQVRAAAEMGAADILLLSESLNRYRVDIECNKGHTSKVTVEDPEDKVECPECGALCKVVDKVDLIDSFFEIAEGYNTQVQLISQDSEEGDMLMRAFGGFAAILRYKV